MAKNDYFSAYFDSWKKGKLFWCIVVAVIIGFITGTIQRFPENPLYVIGALLGCTIIFYLFAALLVGFIYAKIRCAIDKNKYTIVPRYSEEEFEKYFIQKFIAEIKPNITPEKLEALSITNENCKSHVRNGLLKRYFYSTYKVNDSWVVIEQSGTYTKSSYSLIPTLNGNLRDDVATLVNHFKNTSDSERRKVLDADWKNICFGFVVTYKGVYFTIYLYNKDELEYNLSQKKASKK